MTRSSKFSWVVLGSVLVFALGGTAFAEWDTGEATVQFVPIANNGGILSVAITNADFGEHEYRLIDHVASGTLTIYASDMRGTTSGWTVTLAGSDLTSPDNPDFPISIGSLYAPSGTVRHIGLASGQPTD